jgi:hypothetical protein
MRIASCAIFQTSGKREQNLRIWPASLFSPENRDSLLIEIRSMSEANTDEFLSYLSGYDDSESESCLTGWLPWPL